MILNLLHRPETPENFHLFRWQQDLAHRVGLKVTIRLDGANLERPEVIAATLKDRRRFGDDVGIWLNPSSETRLADVNNRSEEPFLWLQCETKKRRLLESMHTGFISAFGFEPSCAGAYHLDQTGMAMLTEIMPQTKTVIAGCFEEGVRVFHGCNHSWYLFNEGMPWYPSKTHALKPAPSEDDWTGLVAVPHLIRDLVLSYEGRNDFFASHPQNVQRTMSNVGAEHPYDYNLLEQHRLQEDFNHGYSWVHVFVGPNWLSNNHNSEDSDEITQGILCRLPRAFCRHENPWRINRHDHARVWCVVQSQSPDWTTPSRSRQRCALRRVTTVNGNLNTLRIEILSYTVLVAVKILTDVF